MTGFCCFLKSCRPRFRAGIPQSTVRDAYCYLYDLYPTLCGLAGIGVPATVKGISLEETLRNPEAGKREDILLTYDQTFSGPSRRTVSNSSSTTSTDSGTRNCST